MLTGLKPSSTTTVHVVLLPSVLQPVVQGTQQGSSRSELCAAERTEQQGRRSRLKMTRTTTALVWAGVGSGAKLYPTSEPKGCRRITLAISFPLPKPNVELDLKPTLRRPCIPDPNVNLNFEPRRTALSSASQDNL